jgi:murein DD-endopeptidase MepM/ murein hydrolase activator NlpD
MPRSLRNLVAVVIAGAAAWFVGVGIDGRAGPVAAEDPTQRVESLDGGGAALARAVRGVRFVPFAFPMNPQPRCAILANFGEARSGARSHQGIDILATLGQEVFASASGTLTGQMIDGEPGSSLSGNYWTLTTPDGDRYTVMHLSRFADGLEVGDDVVVGQLIGYVGDTGNPGSGNYHLHFEYRPAGEGNVDPITVLRAVIPSSCTMS